MKKSRFGRARRPPGLMLTSLLDMFTIILIFLIVSFEAQDVEFKMNPDVQLPESSAKRQLKPAVNLVITPKGVLIEDELAVVFKAGKPRNEDIDQGKIPELVEVLTKKYEQRFGEVKTALSAEPGTEPIIVVQSDKRTGYATLYVVLRSAAVAGFFKYRLAILKK
jgi:biopolymer transport protein ExbD